MLLVPLAPRADQIMEPQLDSHAKRQFGIHRLGKNPHDLTTFRGPFADEFHQRSLESVSTRQNRRIALRRRIILPTHTDPPGECPLNQFISRHSRKAIRARCNITQRLFGEILKASQIWAVSISSISRSIKTSATRRGSLAKQFLNVSQNSLRYITTSASGFHSSGPKS